MSVKILYFASLREKLGCASEELALPEGVSTLGGLRAHLAARGGAWAEGAALARAGAAAGPAERPGLLCALGAVMTRAYGGGDDDLAWWMARWAGP